MKPHLHGIHILLLPSLQKDLASPLSENYCSQRHRIGLCAAQLYSCIFSTPQTRYKSMLFWIGADHYRHKQAKTFGSQVAESAVCARLHPPLMFSGYRPAVLRDNNTGASQTVYLLYFTHISEENHYIFERTRHWSFKRLCFPIRVSSFNASSIFHLHPLVREPAVFNW